MDANVKAETLFYMKNNRYLPKIERKKKYLLKAVSLKGITLKLKILTFNKKGLAV